MVSLTNMTIEIFTGSVSEIHDSLLIEIEKVAEIRLVYTDYAELEARAAAFLGLPYPMDDDEVADAAPPPLPACFQCEDNCDECSVHTPKEFNECSVSGLCSDCEYEVDCWEGRLDDEVVEPAKPGCFNCKDRCWGCTKVDNPFYCLQCKICDLKDDCSVYRGYMQTYKGV